MPNDPVRRDKMPESKKSVLYTEEVHEGGNLGDPDNPKTIASLGFSATRGILEGEGEIWGLLIEAVNPFGEVIGTLTLKRSHVGDLQHDLNEAVARLDAEIQIHNAEVTNGLHASRKQ